jgi:glucose-6-phosphate dehydrogenase assembly protein OpcA
VTAVAGGSHERAWAYHAHIVLAVLVLNASSVLAGIERQLREVWIPQPGEASKSRVCTMNLVVIAGTPALAHKYTPIVDEVTSSIPARAIIVALDPEATESSLEGDVSAVCGVGEDATCSERVRLTAKGALCARAGSAVDALLVPEIPTTLVWLGRVHVEDPVFLELATVAGRIVLDTEYTSLSSLLHLARWARAEPSPPGVADLAWTRIAPWQELCARFFDEPRLMPHARRIKKLTISQASDAGSRLGPEGALLLGWFATRLGWKVERLGGKTRFMRDDGKPITLSLLATPRPTTVAPSVLAAVTVETEHDDGGTARGSIQRELGSGLEGKTADADLLVWRLESSGGTLEQRVRLGTNTGARMLERTLRRPAHDPALAESALFADAIYEEGLVCS